MTETKFDTHTKDIPVTKAGWWYPPPHPQGRCA
jgi:hypothetical protein